MFITSGSLKVQSGIQKVNKEMLNKSRDKRLTLIDGFVNTQLMVKVNRLVHTLIGSTCFSVCVEK